MNMIFHAGAKNLYVLVFFLITDETSFWKLVVCE